MATSQNDYILDYILDYYVDSTGVPVVEGEYDFDVGTPGNAAHRTAFASSRALELAYWQPGSPWAPFSVQPVFIMYNHLGIYAFSDRGIPQAAEDLVMRFDTTLAELDPISFRSVPLSANLLGSVSAIEKSQGRVVINDPDGYWAQKMWREAIVGMPAGLFWLVKGLYTQPALTGTVGRISYSQRRLTMFFGNFRRDSTLNARPVIGHL
jgi:hypothetical protein